MPRVFIQIEESPLTEVKKVSLRINEREIMLSRQELDALLTECLWARDVLNRFDSRVKQFQDMQGVTG